MPTNGHCPHCDRNTDFEITAQAPSQTQDKVFYAIGFCKLCRVDIFLQLIPDRSVVHVLSVESGTAKGASKRVVRKQGPTSSLRGE